MAPMSNAEWQSHMTAEIMRRAATARRVYWSGTDASVADDDSEREVNRGDDGN